MISTNGPQPAIQQPAIQQPARERNLEEPSQTNEQKKEPPAITLMDAKDGCVIS